jgi:Fe-S cluster assembly iron-binding protein IscA
MHLSGPIPAGLPADANEWVFSDHARQRMDQRHLSAIAVLRSACTPTIQRPGKTEDTMVFETDGVRVVVNPDTKEILTAARADYQERKAL